MKEKVLALKEKAGGFIGSKIGKVAVLGSAVASNMAVLANAADETTGGGDMAAVTGGISSIGTLMTSVISLATSNPILAMFFAAGVIGLVWGLFQKFKHK